MPVQPSAATIGSMKLALVSASLNLGGDSCARNAFTWSRVWRIPALARSVMATVLRAYMAAIISNAATNDGQVRRACTRQTFASRERPNDRVSALVSEANRRRGIVLNLRLLGSDRD